jgi:hypothetical protein
LVTYLEGPYLPIVIIVPILPLAVAVDVLELWPKEEREGGRCGGQRMKQSKVVPAIEKRVVLEALSRGKGNRTKQNNPCGRTYHALVAQLDGARCRGSHRLDGRGDLRGLLGLCWGKERTYQVR